MKFIKVIKSSQFNFNEEEEEKVETGEQARQFIAKGLRNYTQGLSGVKLLMAMRKYLMYVLSVTTNAYIRTAASERLKHLEL